MATSKKTLSFYIQQKNEEKRRKTEKRIEEIEDWLMDNPFTHPDYQSLVSERNNLLITIR